MVTFAQENSVLLYSARQQLRSYVLVGIHFNMIRGHKTTNQPITFLVF